jgi:MFS family permease
VRPRVLQETARMCEICGLELHAMPGTRSLKITLPLASCLTVMSGAPITPALPSMREHFGDHPWAHILVPIVLTLPALFIAIGSLLAGPLVDRWGRKPFLLVGTLLFTIAGTAGYVIDDLGLLLLSRAALGIGVAGIMTGTTTLIGDYFRDDERDRLLGAQAAVMGIGGIVLILIGGALAEQNWRAPFLVFISAIAVLPVVWFCVPEPERAVRHPARKSAFERAANPRTIALINAIALVGMIVFFMIPVQIPFLLRELTNASRIGIAAVIAAGTVFAAIASILHRRLLGALGYRHICTIMLALFALGNLVIFAARSNVEIFAGVAINGLGTGLLLPNLNSWVLAEAPVSTRGRYVGWLNTCFFFGQFASPLVVLPLIEPFGLSGAFGVVGVAVGILGGVFALANARSLGTKKGPADRPAGPDSRRN